MDDTTLTAAQERLLAAIDRGEVFYRPGRGNHVWDHHKPGNERPSTVTTQATGLVYRDLVRRPTPRASGCGRLTEAGKQYLASLPSGESR